ncbi:hypothetical protein [Azospirillum picis]|uniref:HAMP domain-containing protein n=1 Tax=Azospirillum picis TaxID=488438 RepID=A0ABU0MFM1_9PROT|nr:hypothetical protein [Azospirillum picis]MBP2298709.1 hypothetical protein [Azospirillum picis]MDQ0532242.1 hypothetical protein [Azospirillum picis]
MTMAARRSHRLFTIGVPAAVLLAAMLAMAAVGVMGTWLAQEQLGEARAAKAAAVAEAVQHDLERAIGYGIPLERIEGVDAYMQGIAGRNPDLGFLALAGRDGTLLQGAVTAGAGGPTRVRLTELSDALRGLPTPETRAATLQPVERDGFLILRLPVRIGRFSSEGGGGGASPPPAGHVLVGVQPGQVRGQIAGELSTVALGGAGVLLLLAELAGVLARASLAAPLRRLGGVMDEAAGGRFGTLLGRRPRDQVGRLLFAFNAVVFGLYDRRQRFAAHADEVRAAVFDPEVAAAVDHARLEALQALGPGLATAPRRVVDSRADDVLAFVVPAAAAGTLLVAVGLAAAGWADLGAAAVILVLSVMAGHAVPAGRRRLAALAAALLALAAGAGWFGGAAAPSLLQLPAGALCGGLSAGLALSYVRRQVREEAGTAAILRALGSGILAALLWGAAVGWDAAMLAGSALLPAALAALLARAIVVPRS